MSAHVGAIVTECRHLRKLLRERDARIAELEKQLADAKQELEHWENALNLGT